MDDLLKFEKFMDRNIDFIENEMDIEKLDYKKEFKKYSLFSDPFAMTILKILEILSNKMLSNLKLKESNNRIVLLRLIKTFYIET